MVRPRSAITGYHMVGRLSTGVQAKKKKRGAQISSRVSGNLAHCRG